MRPGRAFEERRAGPDDRGRRLDRVLRSYLGDVPLSALYRAMRRGLVLVNGGRKDGGYRVAEGDSISFAEGLRGGETPSPSPDRLDTLDPLLALASADLLFLNKPRGLLVHGGDDSLEARVRVALAGRSGASLSFAPGPLHRLDRNTSGLVTFPRSAEGARAFTRLVRERRVGKLYLALLGGRLTSAEDWSDSLVRDRESRVSAAGPGGRPARCRVRPLLSSERLSLALVELETGLTHQIRAQASARGLSLAGDAKYGGARLPGGYVLHALALRFPEPPFPDVPGMVVAPPPAGARAALDRAFGAAEVELALEAALLS